MGFNAIELYEYLDTVREFSLDVDFVEDICTVVLDYHRCGCRGRLYRVEEIVNAAEDNPDMFGEIFFRNGIDEGLEVVGSLARLILYKKLNSYVVVDMKYLPKDIADIKNAMKHIRKSGVLMVSSKGSESSIVFKQITPF